MTNSVEKIWYLGRGTEGKPTFKKDGRGKLPVRRVLIQLQEKKTGGESGLPFKIERYNAATEGGPKQRTVFDVRFWRRIVR